MQLGQECGHLWPRQCTTDDQVAKRVAHKADKDKTITISNFIYKPISKSSILNFSLKL